MSDPQRIIAVVRDYDEMIGVLRDRITALDCPNEPLEEFMGLTRGHLGKILGQAENKRVGLFVLWRMFEGLGLVMGIHEHLDLDATIDEMGEKYRKRAHWAHSQGLRKRVAPAIMKAAAQHYGSLGRGKRKTFRLTPKQRSQIARSNVRKRNWRPVGGRSASGKEPILQPILQATTPSGPATENLRLQSRNRRSVPQRHTLPSDDENGKRPFASKHGVVSRSTS